ncbi:hypothetical protein [Arenicella xantha]|uniref:Uncharacterized protein n=1 Tax=Arenicella xantha TaxID=644221 RepID=A0A395JED8_9GAMM|nr:hypothetical protein [Arenicella xantha]RBP47047.1 hypothetical protein DFR28_11010 [Arenicella xantha]
MEKLILDIRFFSNVEEIAAGDFKNSFEIPKSAHAIGARVARKLRELKFALDGFDHVYVNFTTEMKEHDVGISRKASAESWFKYFDVGIDKQTVNEFTKVELLDFVEEYTFKVLSLICSENQRHILDDVKALIVEKKTELEILHKHKETKSYEVKISYQIRPNGSNDSRANIYYRDKKSGKEFTSHIDLELYEDVFSLVAGVSVQQGKINLKPRSSFPAGSYNKKYRVPISIEIEQQA